MEPGSSTTSIYSKIYPGKRQCCRRLFEPHIRRCMNMSVDIDFTSVVNMFMNVLVDVILSISVCDIDSTFAEVM